MEVSETSQVHTVVDTGLGFDLHLHDSAALGCKLYARISFVSDDVLIEAHDGEHIVRVWLPTHLAQMVAVQVRDYQTAQEKEQATNG